ncbi:MAG: hypothetical protein IJP42_03960 [Selenomonadaceae bacterium]|nr:hypothetical protein [Selenomonadaceae bacterium]
MGRGNQSQTYRGVIALLKKIFCLVIICAALFVPFEAYAETNWFWLDSNDKYSKYFEPESVTIKKKVVTSDGREIAIEIEAWTKTTYSYEGAAETIKNYGIANILPDPKNLTYSLALLRVNPQNRTLQYVREDFYNAEHQVVWSKEEGRVKEINTRSFDEEFYCAIVDEVFQMGERDRKRALTEERWLDLWTYTDGEGNTTNLTADTTTMRLKGTNLILWEWQATKDARGQTIEIRFMKKAVNLTQGTEVIKDGQIWTPNNSWQKLQDEYDGAYRMIRSDDPDYKGLVRLRAYVKNNSRWVTRYSLN